MTIEEARKIIQTTLSFDYLHGRIMKVNLRGDTLNPWGYDRDLGQGAALSVVEGIRKGIGAPKNTESLSGTLEKTIAIAEPTQVSGNVSELGIDAELLRALEKRRVIFRPSGHEN